jgi:hypothetical protein
MQRWLRGAAAGEKRTSRSRSVDLCLGVHGLRRNVLKDGLEPCPRAAVNVEHNRDERDAPLLGQLAPLGLLLPLVNRDGSVLLT